jgi:glycosyltransferase involved in cell wall biosynthesis
VYLKILDAASDEPKVKLYRNEKNLDCYFNKQKAVSLCSNEWLILLDSDNIIDRDYLDRLYEFDEWQRDIIYQPCYAKPTFKFKAFEGLTIDRENVHSFIGRGMFDTMLNAMNYFVNRDEYLNVWDGNVNPHTADSIYQAYNWFNAGNKMLVVDGLEYIHRVHDGSHYKNNNHKTGNFYEEVVENLKALR